MGAVCLILPMPKKSLRHGLFQVLIASMHVSDVHLEFRKVGKGFRSESCSKFGENEGGQVN